MGQQHIQTEQTTTSFLTQKSLSVVLPAYNEEEIIATTINQVLSTLSPWLADFEVIVVNDGSRDGTQAIVETLAVIDTRVRIINHEQNQGYGAALVSGFATASKDLTFFMDSDGQFDIADLATFFPLIEHFDAVLGYRLHRQDTWIRKLNAACWKLLITLMFGISVRDIDCAFKLFHTSFFRHNTLETRGAMINVEMLYKLKRDRCTSTQVGVHHLPRTSGKATGAKLSVILRAFRELLTYAQKWHAEERQAKSYSIELK
jgi:glycosyltransferase involved in cell wall biosynthesis